MITLEFVNFEELIVQSPVDPIFIDDFDTSDTEQKEKLNKLLYTRYGSDSLDPIPSCGCGELVGQEHVGDRCPTCHVACTPAIERPLEPILWLKVPEGVDAFISPMFWIMLDDATSITNFNIMSWLCDPYYIPKSVAHRQAEKFLSLNIPRGINYFYQNFDDIIALLHEKRLIKRGADDINDDLLLAIKQYRDCIFTRFLPVPNRHSFIVEDTNAGTYTDTNMTYALDACHMISSINSAVVPLGVKYRESRVTKAIQKLSSYYLSFIKDSLQPKEGWFRQHVYGSRLHFTARAVISSLHENHHYEELHIPWGVGVQLLKMHLTNKLLKRGMSPKEITSFLFHHVKKYHPLLDELFKELIRESPYMGIPVTFQRNPSLQRGSAQAFYITKVKENPEINTISFSVLALSAPNAD